MNTKEATNLNFINEICSAISNDIGKPVYYSHMNEMFYVKQKRGRRTLVTLSENKIPIFMNNATETLSIPTMRKITLFYQQLK